MRGARSALSAAAAACPWASAALFAGSLAYFLFTYTFTFAAYRAGAADPADVAWNAGLFSVFALHHSVFARTGLKRAVARMVPAHLERPLYVAVASVLFILVCREWRLLAGRLWHVEGAGAVLLHAGQIAAGWLVIRSARVIDVRNLAGVTPPARAHAHGASAPAAADVPATDFKTTGPYGWVRHPIYAAWLLLVFSVPSMTATRFELAAVSALYILLAIPLEERTLRAAAAGYGAYAQRVRWRVIPGVY